MFQQTPLVLSILAQLILVLLRTTLPRHEKALSPATQGKSQHDPLEQGITRGGEIHSKHETDTTIRKLDINTARTDHTYTGLME